MKHYHPEDLNIEATVPKLLILITQKDKGVEKPWTRSVRHF